LPCSFLSLAG